jgi:very-short-patch-repair endonuclease
MNTTCKCGNELKKGAKYFCSHSCRIKALKGRKLSSKHINNIKHAMINREITWGDKISQALVGKKLAIEHKEKLKLNHVGMLGKKHSNITLDKMRTVKLGSSNPLYGTKTSDSTKTKQRLAAINHIEKIRGRLRCNIGKNETQLLNNKEKQIGHEIKRQFLINDLGYIVDGYCEFNNTVYEVYEKFHNNIKSHDVKRQNEIQRALNCNFEVIKDA